MSNIKICGLTRKEDIDIVNNLKPQYVGFVFAKSKRQVSKEKAQELIKILDTSILPIGVFVNATIEEILESIRITKIKGVQLHGDENNEFIECLKKQIDDIIIIKAIKGDENAIQNANHFHTDYILFDNKEAGSGKTFDWTFIKNYTKPFFIAGGINPENSEEVQAFLNPYCMDISSGVETLGFKDEKKIKEIMVKNMTKKGRFGEFGGQYVPETLMNALIELEKAYEFYKNDESFKNVLSKLFTEYAARPSLLYFAENMTKDLGTARFYLKREDLNHTGSHKINNVLGQVLLAKKMGKKKVIAETGAGQHGVATATAAAYFGLECEIFMGSVDVERQALNVFRMRLLGAKVHSVESGTKTLKDAVNEAMREWVARIEDTFYVFGSVMGPHPYPTIVRDFQSIIGQEVKEQMLEKEGRLPDYLIACVGGGSNAMGLFYPFIEEKSVQMIGVEAAGKGVDTPLHAATITKGSIGVFHGMKSYFLQDEEGQIIPVHSISAGLDYPGIGPEHSYLHSTKRCEYVSITDDEAVEAFQYLTKTEGIIPAIESAHAVAYAIKVAKQLGKDDLVVINLSGRGDKDVYQVAKYMGVDLNEG